MVGQIFMTIAYKRGSALLASNLSYTTVVFASLFGGILWHEAHTPLAWAGIILIAASGMVMSALSRRPEPIAAD
jgi:drug/metabolite transporter (DMT)-like permease